MPGTTLDDFAVTTGAERAKLEDQRARLDQQIEALGVAEAALPRYAELAGQDHPPPVILSGGAPLDALPSHHRREPPGGAPAPELLAPDPGNGIIDPPGAPSSGTRGLAGGQDADCGPAGAARAGEDDPLA